MSIQATGPQDLLGQFNRWATLKREGALASELPVQVNENGTFSQGYFLHKDIQDYKQTFSAYTKYHAATLVQVIVSVVASPFALLAEIYSAPERSIPVTICLKNIAFIPRRILEAVVLSAAQVGKIAAGTLTTVSTGTGLLVWHGSEWVVRSIRGEHHTALPKNTFFRDAIYRSIGLTALAAAAVFVPFAPVQMAALPILFGSIYGTIQAFLISRQCPDFFKKEVVATDHLLTKSLVIGCGTMAPTSMVAGAIFATLATAPYKAAILPLPYAAAMFAGVCAISLIAGQVLAGRRNSELRQQTLPLNIHPHGLPEYVNSERLQKGDQFVNVGAVVVAVSTVFLRVFAL